MKIKKVEKMSSGYFSLKAVAKLKRFCNTHGEKIIIPEGYAVVTDGEVWNIVKD
jgi:hypothetical protein